MCTPQDGTLLTSLAVGTTTVEQMLHTHMKNIKMLSEGALMTTNETDRPYD